MRNRVLILIVSFCTLTFACSNLPNHTAPSEKEFGIPDDLAKKFESKSESAPAPEPVVVAKEEEPKATEIPVVPTQKGGKKSKAKAKVEPPKPKVTKTAKVEALPNRWSMTPFFKVGEHYSFDITYFGATAGIMEMDILPNVTVNGRDCYHVQARARTAPVFDLFYRLNDVAESYLDSSALLSHKFSLKLDESLQQREVLELYDQKAKKVYFWSKLDHKKKGKSQEQFESPISEFTQDSISAFYYLRTLPLEVGKVYPFPLVLNGRLTNVQVTVVRKEELNTKIGTFPTIVVKPEAVIEGVLKSAGDSFIWISDDAERRILKIDAKIKVGKVIGYLREHNYNGPTKAKN